jgi:hypothetical protein
MMKIKITKEQVGKVLVKGGKLALSALAIGFASLIRDKASNAQYYIGDVGYGDAIGAILNSDMFDSTKTEAIELLKRDESVDYYRAVIAAVNSSMFDMSKIQTIKKLSEKMN